MRSSAMSLLQILPPDAKENRADEQMHHQLPQPSLIQKVAQGLERQSSKIAAIELFRVEHGHAVVQWVSAHLT